jgi:hypothetical protein
VCNVSILVMLIFIISILLCDLIKPKINYNTMTMNNYTELMNYGYVIIDDSQILQCFFRMSRDQHVTI